MPAAEEIINEIDTFLDKSMLKTSKITQEELIHFVEEKWKEADDKKYSIYAAYIINSRMINEYIGLKDFDNMMRWLDMLDLHSASQKDASYITNYYKGECCLECGNEEKALEYFNLSYAENPEYIFSQAPFCYEFFNRYLENPKEISDFEENEVEYYELNLELNHWQRFFRTDDHKFPYEIFDEGYEYTEEPTQGQENGLIYLQENQERILENMLLELLKRYPDLQKKYNFSKRDKVNFMPDLKDIQGFSDLLSPTYFYVTSVIKDSIPYIGYGFSCSWDSEHGLGIMTHKDRIVEIGGAEIAFDNWTAEKDLGVSK
nr:hypothetical protein [uncultured Chryseobacterium sp.]